MEQPPGGPRSELYTLKKTPFAGRAVFATHFIPAGTPLLSTRPPHITVILREYRKEVCAQCFAYDRGREWKIRNSSIGFVFCSKNCQRQWREEAGELGFAAWQTLESFIQSSLKNKPRDEDGLPDAETDKPTPDEIADAWARGEEKAQMILKLRREQPNSKAANRAITKALAKPVAPDILPFLLSGLLLYIRSPGEWEEHAQLAIDTQPYGSADILQLHVQSLHQLVALLPPEIIPSNVAEILQDTLKHEMHNSFGIRSLDDEGDEFFGYGVWTEASYNNHSCHPNIAKKRVGPSWHFWADRDVQSGEELSISYLGGEEKELNVLQRRARLKEIWGFECACVKCIEEAGLD